MSTAKLTCTDCNEPALYVRHTQFAGSHPFCMTHAMLERDFLRNDSHASWEKLDRAGYENPPTDHEDP